MREIQRKQNPFDIVKATDFDDLQIFEFWVDIPGGGGFESIVKPKSPMPMIIKGGKGSGKTHLLRYFSFQIEKLRTNSATDLVGNIRSKGYLGTFVRCSGLNANRFAIKSGDTQFKSLFAYYFDIWLSQLLLENVYQLVSDPKIECDELELARQITDLFDRTLDNPPTNLNEVSSLLEREQKKIDYQINNSVFGNDVDIEILSTPGKLVFGLPRIIRTSIPALEDVLFVYLIDELENFNKDQQSYIQTLIREKDITCTLKVGVRSYGIKTYLTWADGEENKEGSEFELVKLDSKLRANSNYPDFARNLIAHRLNEAGFGASSLEDKNLESFFESRGIDEAVESGESEIPLRKLKKDLQKAEKKGLIEGMPSGQNISELICSLRTEDALLTKARVYKTYQRINDQKPIFTEESIKSICSEAPTSLEYFKSDFFAQLNKKRSKIIYSGLPQLIKMSEGFPRLLLTTLKYIYSTAIFRGEKPFSEGKISIESQHHGLRESSDWFFDDTRMEGSDGIKIKTGISNFAEILRINRFSDKPIECSCVSFNCEEELLSERTRQLIRTACDYSLLLNISDGASDKNSGKVIRKYRLNTMLSVRWNLPVNSRGSLKLVRDSVESIFGGENDYEKFKSKFSKRVNYPFNLENKVKKNPYQPEIKFD